MTTTLQAYSVSQVMNDYRATPATYTDSSGTLQDAPINSLLLDYDATTLILKGYTARESRTNLLTNPRGVGAVAGSPGTPPTNWNMAANGGSVVASIVGSGIEAGLDYVDVNFSGTVTAQYISNSFFDTNAACPVVAGQNYTFSLGTKLVGGSLANIVAIEQAIVTYSSSAPTSAIATHQGPAFTPGATRFRQSFTQAMDANAAYGRPELYIIFGTGTVNATIRFYDPVFELGSAASTIIRPPAGTVATSTRGADDIRLALQSGWLDGASNTFLIEAILPQAAPAGQDQGLVRIDDGTDANKFVIVNVGGGTSVHAQLTLGGTLVSDLILGGMVVGSPFRAIAGYSLVVGNGVTAGILSGGNHSTGVPTVAAVPTFSRALVGRSSLNAGRAIEESARHANGQIAEIMIAKGVVLDENTMLYMSQMNLTVGALLTSAGVVLGGT